MTKKLSDRLMVFNHEVGRTGCNYDNIYAKMRSEIELLFKVAKRVFMLDNVHVHHR